MLHRMRILLAIVAGLLWAGTSKAVDLHQFWDENCAGCHGHSAEFAREKLDAGDSNLVRFLQTHHGRRSAERAQALADMLTAQTQTTPQFQERCSICHVKAADVARRFLISRDGVLYGRYSGRRMDEFLVGHGRLAPHEVDLVVALLARIEGEVHHAD